MSHSILNCAINQLAFITYRGTIPTPTSWQTTSCIRHWNPAGGRQALPERDCAGRAEWFRCHQQELSAVFPGQFQWRWRRELVSCYLARIVPESRQIPANLKCLNKYYSNTTHDWHTWYNWYNYHSQGHHMFPASIWVRIRIQCQLQQMRRIVAKPEHTRQNA